MNKLKENNQKLYNHEKTFTNSMCYVVLGSVFCPR